MIDQENRKLSYLYEHKSEVLITLLVLLLLVIGSYYYGLMGADRVTVIREIEHDTNYVLANTNIKLSVDGDIDGTVNIIDRVNGEEYEFNDVPAGETVEYQFSSTNTGVYQFQGIYMYEDEEGEIIGDSEIEVVH